MEEEKLLRFLNFLLALTICSLICNLGNLGQSMAESNQNEKITISDEERKWVKAMQNQLFDYTQKGILAKYQELQMSQNIEWDADTWINPTSHLRIFVSSSMSKSLLTAYYHEAQQYGAALVFKGLPNGSFKELSKLVLDITGEGEVGSMQIDDEAFERFNITSVPTIILSQETDCLFQEQCSAKYDSISGSIAVKLALEHFASSGDLQEEAKGLLANEDLNK